MGATPSTFPISTASFRSDFFYFDPLFASETISQSANLAGGLNVAGSPLKRGTVLYGPAVGTPITPTILLTTSTAAGAARCILAQDTDTSGGSVMGLVYTQGKFLDYAMTFSAAGAASDAAELWQFGVYVLTVMARSGMLIPMMNLPTTGGQLPRDLSPKDARERTQQEVDQIKAAIEAFRPAGVPYTPPPLQGVEPAWAVAAFGEPTLTPEQQAKQDAAEKAGELADKQKQALEELEAKQAKELADLSKQQTAERNQLAEETADALQAAREQQAQQQPPSKTPPVPSSPRPPIQPPPNPPRQQPPPRKGE